jgi:hypothetical protein
VVEWEKILWDKCGMDMPALLTDWASFFAWWCDATITWPQALAIILYHQLFLAGIHCKWPGKEQMWLLEEIWCCYHELASLLFKHINHGGAMEGGQLLIVVPQCAHDRVLSTGRLVSSAYAAGVQGFVGSVVGC